MERIKAMIAAGFGGQVILSHDRSWYSPAEPGGGTPKPFTYLCETFLPKLRVTGVREEDIRLMTASNLFRVLARE